MAYLRWGEKLPSGIISKSYIFGDPRGLVNIDKGVLITYQYIRDLLKCKNNANIKENLKQKLDLQGEELEVVCSRLFYEKNNGEWDKPFDFE